MTAITVSYQGASYVGSVMVASKQTQSSGFGGSWKITFSGKMPAKLSDPLKRGSLLKIRNGIFLDGRANFLSRLRHLYRRADLPPLITWFRQQVSDSDSTVSKPLFCRIFDKDVISEYAVDAGKVCVAGLSSGGSMTVILGRAYPDLLTAVGCHSGLPHGAATDRYGAMRAMRHGPNVEELDGMAVADGVPTIVFHGDLDSTVHPKNGGRIVRQSLLACAATQTHAQEVGEATGRTFARDIHRSESGDIFAEHWTVHGAGHAWSGGSRRGSYTDANGPDASEKRCDSSSSVNLRERIQKRRQPLRLHKPRRCWRDTAPRVAGGSVTAAQYKLDPRVCEDDGSWDVSLKTVVLANVNKPDFR